MTFRVSLFAIAYTVVAFLLLNWLIGKTWAPSAVFIGDAIIGVCGIVYARQTAAAALPIFIFLWRAEYSLTPRLYYAFVGVYWLAIFIGVAGEVSYFLDPSLYTPDWT